MEKTNIITEEFTITLQYRMTVDTETGEILKTELIKRSVDKENIKVVDAPKKKKSSKKEESNIPTLTLEENKYYLNSAAIELMGVSADDKIDIKYEKSGKEMRPIIGTDEIFGTKSGNRLTKSNSVAYRGSKQSELAKFGTNFEIVPHDSKEGLFILKGDKIQESNIGNEDIRLEEGDEDLPIDLNIEGVDDADITEIDSNFFVL